jgi:hypothetical protein
MPARTSVLRWLPRSFSIIPANSKTAFSYLLLISVSLS